MTELSAAATPTDVVTVAVRCTAALLDTPAVGVWEVTPTDSLQPLDPSGLSDVARSVWGRIESDANAVELRLPPPVLPPSVLPPPVVPSAPFEAAPRGGCSPWPVSTPGPASATERPR